MTCLTSANESENQLSTGNAILLDTCPGVVHTRHRLDAHLPDTDLAAASREGEYDIKCMVDASLTDNDFINN